ncbi:MAG: transposase [Candidatus Omnitrophica bacterium]|nr:transposase [Candidatus Omnitrophota bacterium]
MPRAARIIIDDACYHVISRGNDKQIVFKEDGDFQEYLKILRKYKTRFKFKIYGWCLMSNHVHLLVESNNLSKVMHGINLSYAKYFKEKYKTIGHFWQDRFKSYVIRKDNYMISCITYIEYNPLRANLVNSVDEYVWSSYRARVLGKKLFNLLDNVEL